jgi:hypothetical protein
MQEHHGGVGEMKRVKGFKKTYGVGLNNQNPDDARLMARLEPMPRGDRAAFIRAALLAYIDGGTEQVITEQELAELRAELAWHRQNQDAAAVIMTVAAQAVSTETPGQSQSAAPSGPVLSPTFLAAVRKAAKPGIRLGE